ncbi:MAG: DUF5668 domain-containing protein [Bacteroidota bacterium]
MTTETNNNKRSLILGIIFIVVGGIFLLENFSLLPYDFFEYIFSWEAILILIGGVLVSTRENKVPGFILIGIGGLFLLEEFLQDVFRWYWFDAPDLIWPLAIIGIGVAIILRRNKSNDDNYSYDEKKNSSTDFLKATAILGGGDIKVNSTHFRGGDVTAIMGGGTYDLSSAELAEGPQVIDVFALFGGASFIVPSDWNVRIEVTPLFGGFSDSRKVNSNSPGVDPTKELVLKGTVIFGGGELKNFV